MVIIKFMVMVMVMVMMVQVVVMMVMAMVVMAVMKLNGLDNFTKDQDREMLYNIIRNV